MGPCMFTGKNGSTCSCTSGYCISNTTANTNEERCENCDHLMSKHAGYVPDSLPPKPSNPLQQRHSIEENPNICPRAETVEKLAKVLEEYRVAHVRGTSCSGKSTLALLLDSYYKRREEPAILFSCWPDTCDMMTHIVSKCKAHGYPVTGYNDIRSTNITFIFDEAQQTYRDTKLWGYLIKWQSGRGGFGPKICLFSSYGSPTNGPLEYHETTPVHFGASQRISITPSPFADNEGVCLFYNLEEFKDVVSRICSNPTTKFTLDPAARDHLYSITNGHPGATGALLGFIFDIYRSDLKHHKIEQVTKDLFIQALDDEFRVFKRLEEYPVQRSFPSEKNLTPGAADVLRTVLHNGNIPFEKDDPAIYLCYRKGWIHSEPTEYDGGRTVCVLPSKLHEKFIEYYLDLRTPRPFPLGRFPTLPDFCKAVLRKFSGSSLRLSRDGRRLGAAAQARPPEAQFQDEWYRAFNSLLGHGFAISSEWSHARDGMIDFRIVGPNWGIELLRDGDRLTEHCNRFLKNGTYYHWIKNNLIKDWIILDCRHTPPKKYQDASAKLWRVIFEDNYSSAYVLNCDNEVIVPKFPLVA